MPLAEPSAQPAGQLSPKLPTSTILCLGALCLRSPFGSVSQSWPPLPSSQARLFPPSLQGLGGSERGAGWVAMVTLKPRQLAQAAARGHEGQTKTGSLGSFRPGIAEGLRLRDWDPGLSWR